jgi:hypothetical protein
MSETTTGIRPKSTSRRMLWTGRVLSFLPAAMLLLDAAMKFVKPAPVIEGTVRLGFSESVITPLGIVLLICVILYLIDRTSVLGAILLTGYLGGAVCTHVRFWEGWFPVVFPVIFGAILWLGLYLRDERIRALVPVKS